MPKAYNAPRVRGDEVESIRRSLVGLRRLFQRKELAEIWASRFGPHSPLDYTMLRLLDAVQASRGQEAGGGTTVGQIARLLGVDASRASRLVASAVTQGLLERHASQEDGRKIALRITGAGARLQARGSEVTRARIALALDGWSDRERGELASLLERFVQHMLLDPG